MHKWCSENLYYNHLSSELAMKSQVLLTVWCNISGEAAGEIWHWSLSGVKGLNRAWSTSSYLLWCWFACWSFFCGKNKSSCIHGRRGSWGDSVNVNSVERMQVKTRIAVTICGNDLVRLNWVRTKLPKSAAGPGNMAGELPGPSQSL